MLKQYKPNGTATSVRTTTLATNYASVADTDELENELRNRRTAVKFPLHIFPDRVKPLINILTNKMDGERNFIGLALLQTTAIAIGSAIRVSTGNWETGLATWGCAVGISSSGKSMMQGVLMRPLYKVQQGYDQEFFQKLREEPNGEHYHKTMLVSDITFEALIRDVLGHNYKGIVKYEDELLKWLQDMERYKSGTSEQSFWTAAWAPTKSFSMKRSGNNYLHIDQKHLVAHVMGSTQPDVLYHFYAKDRLYTGFTFRMLWAFAESDRVISPDLSFRIPDEMLDAYTYCIQRMIKEMPMDWAEDEPQVLMLRRGGIQQLQQWQDRCSKEINALESVTDRNIKAGIYGKIKEYALRFSALLKVLHTSAEGGDFKHMGSIEDQYVTWAIEAANYFYHAGWDAYQVAKAKVMTPPEVLEFAAMLKAYQFNQSHLAQALGISKQAVSKKLKKYIEQYPNAFGAKN